MKKNRLSFLVLIFPLLFYIFSVAKVFVNLSSTIYRIRFTSEIKNILFTSIEIVNSTTISLLTFSKVKTQLCIKLNNKDLKSLNENIPKSGFLYKKGLFIDENNEEFNVKIRYRGDCWNHWGFPRKSWRVKIKRDKLYHQNNKFNLILPKFDAQINNHFSYLLAKKIGILAPESFLTNLSINGVYDGTKLYVEQLNEYFLKKNKRFNANLYKGDNNSTSTVKIGKFIDLFNSASYWKKIVSFNDIDNYDDIKL